MDYQPRTYRNDVQKAGLSVFQVVVKETDLHIQADQPLETAAKDSILRHREILENYIQMYPNFATTLRPWPEEGPRPFLIDEMIRAGRRAGVGPMAAVAGAIAACVGGDLLMHSKEVIVENGGDVFIKTSEPLTVGIYAGDSELSLKMGLRAGGGDSPMAICTSSGTVGHSHSFGLADAVCVVSASCALADAAATAIGNHVGGARDIKSAIGWGRRIQGIQGIIIIAGEKMGVWGELELVSLSGKRG
jgi:ApbE superfamily uncharacterized protein (UPF0280 family)